jgi:hypothetical protein
MANDTVKNANQPKPIKPNWNRMLENADDDEALKRIIRRMKKEGISVPAEYEPIASKSQGRLQPGDRENDRPQVRGKVDPFGYDDEKESELATEMLRGVIDEELNPTKPRLTADEIARAIPEGRENPYGREGDYPQWPGRINPDGRMERVIPPERTEDIQAGPIAQPFRNYYRGYEPPPEAMTEEEIVRAFMTRGKRI